jgi:hypothetical protein
MKESIQQEQAERAEGLEKQFSAFSASLHFSPLFVTAEPESAEA